MSRTMSPLLALIATGPARRKNPPRPSVLRIGCLAERGQPRLPSIWRLGQQRGPGYRQCAGLFPFAMSRTRCGSIHVFPEARPTYTALMYGLYIFPMKEAPTVNARRAAIVAAHARRRMSADGYEITSEQPNALKDSRKYPGSCF